MRSPSRCIAIVRPAWGTWGISKNKTNTKKIILDNDPKVWEQNVCCDKFTFQLPLLKVFAHWLGIMPREACLLLWVSGSLGSANTSLETSCSVSMIQIWQCNYSAMWIWVVCLEGTCLIPWENPVIIQDFFSFDTVSNSSSAQAGLTLALFLDDDSRRWSSCLYFLSARIMEIDQTLFLPREHTQGLVQS